MNADNCALARGLVSPSYVAQGAEALAKRQKLIKTVLSQRRLPQTGWDDATIELFIQARRFTACDCLHTALLSYTWMHASHCARFSILSVVKCPRRSAGISARQYTAAAALQEVALMDSNNFVDNVGVGEREARVACNLVARRHFRLAHGIGRSGNVGAEQPKVLLHLPLPLQQPGTDARLCQ